MAKKIQGSKLRILSIAYAGNRIDRDTYIKLRTQQLAALDFNKPSPPLPPELMDINIPSVKLDAPYVGKRTNNTLIMAAAGVLAVVVLAGGGFYAFNSDLFGGSNRGSVSKIQQLTPESLALKMINAPSWTERDIEIFLKSWSSYSTEAKNAAREEQWYTVLENEIIQRINKLKLQLDTSGDERALKKQLNNLRIFYAQLAAE